jgi:hypothetical protein
VVQNPAGHVEAVHLAVVTLPLVHVVVLGAVDVQAEGGHLVQDMKDFVAFVHLTS